MSIIMLVSVRHSKRQFLGTDQQPNPVGICTVYELNTPPGESRSGMVNYQLVDNSIWEHTQNNSK